jgi:hypothetical protein
MNEFLNALFELVARSCVKHGLFLFSRTGFLALSDLAKTLYTVRRLWLSSHCHSHSHSLSSASTSLHHSQVYSQIPSTPVPHFQELKALSRNIAEDVVPISSQKLQTWPQPHQPVKNNPTPTPNPSSHSHLFSEIYEAEIATNELLFDSEVGMNSNCKNKEKDAFTSTTRLHIPSFFPHTTAGKVSATSPWGFALERFWVCLWKEQKSGTLNTLINDPAIWKLSLLAAVSCFQSHIALGLFLRADIFTIALFQVCVLFKFKSLHFMKMRLILSFVCD